MTSFDPDWLDAQYMAVRGVDAPRLFAEWARRSHEARDALPCRLDLAFGPTPPETLDVFLPPEGVARTGAVLMFIHGGFWRGSDKGVHSFIAPVFARQGTVVVLPNYALCPQVTIATIVQQARAALHWVHANADSLGGPRQRVVVAGHSAGGHLAAMLASAAHPGPHATWALSISGLHDLEPIAHAPFLRADLRLSPTDALPLSPARHAPTPGAVLHAIVGANESDEFRRQTRLLRDAWGADAVPVCEEIARYRHFDIVEALADPQTRPHAVLAALLRAASSDASAPQEP